MANKLAVGDFVKFTTPGLNGPVHYAGRIVRVLPSGSVEIKAQLGGYYTKTVAEVEFVR